MEKHKNIFSDRDIRNNTKIKKKGYEINGRRFKKRTNNNKEKFSKK